MLRIGSIFLVAAVLAAETYALQTPRARVIILTRSRSDGPAYTVGNAAGIEAEFLAAMTPDDVVRGVWALAEHKNSLALTAPQRERLHMQIAHGATERHRLGELRAGRRAAEGELLHDGTLLAEAIGAARTRAILRSGAHAPSDAP